MLSTVFLVAVRSGVYRLSYHDPKWGFISQHKSSVAAIFALAAGQ